MIKKTTKRAGAYTRGEVIRLLMLSFILWFFVINPILLMAKGGYVCRTGYGTLESVDRVIAKLDDGARCFRGFDWIHTMARCVLGVVSVTVIWLSRGEQ